MATPPHTDDRPDVASDDAADSLSEPKRQRRIQSIEVGMRVLQALTEQQRPLALKELAALADMVVRRLH